MVFSGFIKHKVKIILFFILLASCYHEQDSYDNSPSLKESINSFDKLNENEQSYIINTLVNNYYIIERKKSSINYLVKIPYSYLKKYISDNVLIKEIELNHIGLINEKIEESKILVQKNEYSSAINNLLSIKLNKNNEYFYDKDNEINLLVKQIKDYEIIYHSSLLESTNDFLKLNDCEYAKKEFNKIKISEEINHSDNFIQKYNYYNKKIIECIKYNESFAIKPPNLEKEEFFPNENDWQIIINLASKGHLQDAIKKAKQISKHSPFFNIARKKIIEWENSIIEKNAHISWKNAYSKANSGDYQLAIALANQIPSSSTYYNLAQKKVNEWRKIIEPKKIYNILQNENKIISTTWSFNVTDSATSIEVNKSNFLEAMSGLMSADIYIQGSSLFGKIKLVGTGDIWEIQNGKILDLGKNQWSFSFFSGDNLFEGTINRLPKPIGIYKFRVKGLFLGSGPQLYINGVMAIK